ncbi:hypothetical protein Mcup_1101 [Metallosphaera cuprina Ar-4]|uniref:Uncharacterized protein n=1 Tax=Metallosphaera cuprina (strain Ar-4) TaxID=1006006 RepID=F4G308_METCR|nr:hypothetical protein Mcup_1101 [Metallosphaera cuprina Ar-4]
MRKSCGITFNSMKDSTQFFYWQRGVGGGSFNSMKDSTPLSKG